MVFTQKPSPNFSDRITSTIDMVVIHNISLPPKQFGGGYIQDFFCNRLDSTKHSYFEEIKELKVSSHLLILRDGEVLQFVDFEKKAWHAGVSKYKGRENCNEFSIGIELEGADDIKYSEIQYNTLGKVLRFLLKKYPIKYIVGHSDIAPKRKTDPGDSFDWDKLTNELGGDINDYR